MKKIILNFFGLVLIGTLIFVSCEKENNELTDKSALKLKMVDKFRIVGENHNKNLNSIIQDIKKRKITLKKKNDFIKEVNTSLLSVVSSEKSYLSKNEVKKITNDNYYVQFRQTKSKMSNNQIDFLINNSGFSDELVDLLERLIVISNNGDLTVVNEKELINNINEEAVNILNNEQELNIFFIASSVSTHSFEYWKTNIDQWNVLFENNKNESNKNESPYDHPMLDGIVGADVGGAVGGALVAAITGPGVVVGAIAGSTGASTGKFIENAWNYFFN